MQTPTREKYRDLGNGQLQDSNPVTGRAYELVVNGRDRRSPARFARTDARNKYETANSDAASRMTIQRLVAELPVDSLSQASLSQSREVFEEPTEEEVAAFVAALETAHEAAANAVAYMDCINERLAENIRELEATRNVTRWSNQSAAEHGLAKK